MAINYFAVMLDGWDDPAAMDMSAAADRTLYIVDGLLDRAAEGEIDEGLFSAGVLLIRQSFSENYLIDGTTLLTRLPWSENYEANTSNLEQFIRQPWSEDYDEDGTSYTRRPLSEDYESDDFIFERQSNSENYIVVAK
jgi:hypothetical protein